MKFAVTALFLVTGLNAYAITSPQDCLKIKNGLDRKYCLDKNLEAIKSAQAGEKKGWAKGLQEKDKSIKATQFQNSITSKKEYVAHLQNEIALEEKHLAELKKVPVVKKKKKEKKKKGFRIKL